MSKAKPRKGHKLYQYPCTVENKNGTPPKKWYDTIWNIKTTQKLGVFLDWVFVPFWRIKFTSSKSDRRTGYMICFPDSMISSCSPWWQRTWAPWACWERWLWPPGWESQHQRCTSSSPSSRGHPSESRRVTVNFTLQWIYIHIWIFLHEHFTGETEDVYTT